MLQPNDLIDVARLLSTGRRRPTQVQLRRGISSLYYAVFHAAALNCADYLIGKSNGIRAEQAWLEVYRSLSHTAAKAACQDTKGLARFPPPVIDFAVLFASLQAERHDADYNPRARFFKPLVAHRLASVTRVLEAFDKVPQRDRLSFASWLLFRHVTRK